MFVKVLTNEFLGVIIVLQHQIGQYTFVDSGSENVKPTHSVYEVVGN